MGLSLFQEPRRSGAQRGTACLVLAAAGCAALLLSAQPVRAQQVTGVFYISNGFYNYNLSVRNPTAVTLADVDIRTGGSTITNLSAPSGFQITYDAGGFGPGQGVVDFTSTNGVRDFFANTTVNSFLFRSSTNLSGATFDTLNVNGVSTTGTISVTATAGPEPGTLGLLTFGAAPAAGALLAFRRRFVSSVSLKG